MSARRVKSLNDMKPSGRTAALWQMDRKLQRVRWCGPLSGVRGDVPSIAERTVCYCCRLLRNPRLWALRPLISPSLLLCAQVAAYADPPPGYYDSAQGKIGSDLRAALHLIVRGQHSFAVFQHSSP